MPQTPQSSQAPQMSLPETWQMIQLEKRLDANTEGINKVTTYTSTSTQTGKLTA